MLVTAGTLTEPLYLVLLGLVLLMSDSLGSRDRTWKFVALGLLAGLVVLTRTIGIALLGAMLVGAWRRGGARRSSWAVAASGVVLMPWLLFTFANAGRVPEVLVPRYGSYLQLYIASLAGEPTAAVAVVVTNVGAILQTLGARVSPLPGALLQSLVGMLVIALAVLGSRRIFRSAPTIATYPWLYLTVISVWSFPPFRFVFILFPLLLALATVAILALAERAPQQLGRAREGPMRLGRWPRYAITAAGAAVIIVMAWGQAHALARRVWDGAELQKSIQSREVIDWVMDNAEPEAIIAFEFDPLLGVYTERTAVPNNYEPVHPWYRRQVPPVEPLARLLRESGVSYLAVRRGVQAATAPIDALLARYPESLDLIYVTRGGVLIFRTDLAKFVRREAVGPRSDDDRVPGSGLVSARDGV
jgi:hypothetical protein